MKVGSLLGAFLSTLSSLAPSSSLDVAFSLKINPFLWVPLYVLKERRIKKPPGSRQQQAIRLILFRFQSGFLSFSFWLSFAFILALPMTFEGGCHCRR